MPKRSRFFPVSRPAKKRRTNASRMSQTVSVRSRRSRVSTYKARIDRQVNIHKFCRWVETPVDNSLTSTSQGFAAVFQFADLVANSEFTQLYDRYMLTLVECHIQLVTDPASSLVTNSTSVWNPTNWYPKFWYCKDYDDSTVEALSTLKQRANTKCFVLKPNRTYVIKIRPAVLVQTYATALTTGYTPKWNQWIDIATTDIKHYGMKYALDANGLDPNDSYPFKVRIEYKYWFTCKDVR